MHIIMGIWAMDYGLYPIFKAITRSVVVACWAGSVVITRVVRSQCTFKTIWFFIYPFG